MHIESMISEAELDKVLAGDSGYEIQCIDGYIPTDTARVMEQQLTNSGSDSQSETAFVAALIRLAGRQDKGWLVMYYLVDIVHWERKHQKTLLSADVVELIAQNLLKWQAAWSVDRSWNGYQFQDGLWGDVRRLSSILSSKYGINLFGGEEKS
jgi:hypothetical protein